MRILLARARDRWGALEKLCSWPGRKVNRVDEIRYFSAGVKINLALVRDEMMSVADTFSLMFADEPGRNCVVSL